jgi:hypothetical protein
MGVRANKLFDLASRSWRTNFLAQTHGRTELPFLGWDANKNIGQSNKKAIQSLWALPSPLPVATAGVRVTEKLVWLLN